MSNYGENTQIVCQNTVVDNVHTFYCDDCGAVCAVAGSDASETTKLVAATTPDGRHICDVCAGNLQLARMNTGDSGVVYISSDGRTFTTWGGTKLGTVHELGGKDGIWPFKTLEKIMARLPVPCVHWAGVTTDGLLVYGRTMGHGSCATAHPRRRKGHLQVEDGSTLAMEGVN